MINAKTLDILIQYIDNIDKNAHKLSVKKNITKTEDILARLACLTEEVGEFASEIRNFTKLSFNQKKVDSFNPKDLEDECVDVLITNIMVAKSLGIHDLNEAIIRKIQKNNDRGY